MIKNVVFDLGGVLINWDPRNLYRKIFADSKEMDYFLTHICTLQWNSQADAGVPFEQITAELTEKHPEYKEQIALYYPRWSEMLSGEIAGSVQILRELKQKGVPVFALTNWSAQTFPTARRLFPFLSEFDGMVVSGEEKCIKPDPRLYQILLNRYHLRAPESIYIDDNPANVAAAASLGFTAVHFMSPQQLQNALQKIMH